MTTIYSYKISLSSEVVEKTADRVIDVLIKELPPKCCCTEVMCDVLEQVKKKIKYTPINPIKGVRDETERYTCTHSTDGARISAEGKADD